MRSYSGPICATAVVFSLAVGTLLPAYQSMELETLLHQPPTVKTTRLVAEFFSLSPLEAPTDALYFYAVGANDAEALEIALAALRDTPSPQRMQRLWAATRLHLRLYAATNEGSHLDAVRMICRKPARRPELQNVCSQL